MNMEENVETYYDQEINTTVLHLPFNSSNSMLLLLPGDMATLENAISPSYISKWLKWMKSRFGAFKISLKFWVSNMEVLSVFQLLILSSLFLHFLLVHIRFISQSCPSSLLTRSEMC